MAKRYTPEERRAVFEQFMAAGLRPGEGDIQRWYAEKAVEIGVTPSTIQIWVAREKEKAFFSGAGRKATVHQLLAHEVDLTAVDAMLTLKKGLKSKRRTLRMDKEGSTICDFTEPDNQARIQAAEKILKVMGGFTEKLEIGPSDSDISKLSDAELMEELRQVESRTRKALPMPIKTIGGDDGDPEQRLSEVPGSDS